MKTKIFLALSIVFLILTLAGAGYVLVSKGEVNAGYACVPVVFELMFVAAYRKSKKSRLNSFPRSVGTK